MGGGPVLGTRRYLAFIVGGLQSGVWASGT